jgi:predicted translin family RNA/ssDNA-binding protein
MVFSASEDENYMKDQLSTYAAININEFISEAWSEYVEEGFLTVSIKDM